MVDTLSGALKILSRRKIVSSPGDGGHTLQRSLSVVDITCLGETFLKSLFTPFHLFFISIVLLSYFAFFNLIYFLKLFF
jgi:hypothetical protein